jgi:hypothetical protein
MTIDRHVEKETNMESELTNKGSALRLKDVLSRGLSSHIAGDFLPVFTMLDHELSVDESTPRWGVYDAQPPYDLLDREPMENDLVVCEVELQVQALKLNDTKAPHPLYSITATAGVVYRLIKSVSSEIMVQELQRRAKRHARGFLRNRILEEAASMRLPAIPFQQTWLTRKPK